MQRVRRWSKPGWEDRPHTPQSLNESSSDDCRLLRRRALTERTTDLSSLIYEIVIEQIGRDADRIGEADGIRTAMALHRNPIETEKHGAVVTPRVNRIRPSPSKESW